MSVRQVKPAPLQLAKCRTGRQELEACYLPNLQNVLVYTSKRWVGAAAGSSGAGRHPLR